MLELLVKKVSKKITGLLKLQGKEKCQQIMLKYAKSWAVPHDPDRQNISSGCV